MPFISVTRLRIRSLRFLPAFFRQTAGTLAQVRGAKGFRGGALLADRRWAFWTLTAWNDEADMRAYMLGGAHRAAMPSLVDWCDEASVVHWSQNDDALPGWPEAERRMRADGRPSKLRHPGPGHAGLAFPPARLTFAGPIAARR